MEKTEELERSPFDRKAVGRGKEIQVYHSESTEIEVKNGIIKDLRRHTEDKGPERTCMNRERGCST